MSKLSNALSIARHRRLRQLIHFIDEGPAEGFVTGSTKQVIGGLFPTQIVWRTSDGNKLVEKLITRSGGPATNLKPTPIKWKLYDGNGDLPANVLYTVTDTVVYAGIAETDRTRAVVAGDA